MIDGHTRTGDLMPVMTQLGPGRAGGLTRYQSAVFGSDYQDNFFAAMFNLRKVTRHVLEPDGATFRTRDSDFLVSTNRDFHPTDVVEDADGSLLVVDTGPWYKLCCPTSQLAKPDVLGAIYRVKRSARGAHHRSARRQHPVDDVQPSAARGAARRRAAGRARAGDGAAGEDRCGGSGSRGRAAPAFGEGLDPARCRVDVDAHRRRRRRERRCASHWKTATPASARLPSTHWPCIATRQRRLR